MNKLWRTTVQGAINYQNILLDNLDEPINITFSTPSPLNSLVTKCKNKLLSVTLILKNMTRLRWII